MLLKESPSTTLRAGLELWQLAQAAEGKRPTTIKGHREHLRPLFRYLEGQAITEVEALNPFPLRAYFAQYLQTHSPHGAQSVYSSLRAFCNWLLREGLLSQSPLARLKPPKAPVTSKPVYRPGELKALVSALSGDNTPAGLRDAAIVALLMDTGARASEVTGLRLQDIQGEALLLRQTKTGRPRMLFLGKKSSQALHRYLAMGRPKMRPQGDVLFLGRREGEALTRSGLQSLLKRWQSRLGVKLSAHRFRHTWATQMLRSGVDLETLRLLGGWTDYTMLRTYTHLAGEDLREAMKRHSPLDRL